MQFGILGPLAVWRDGDPVQLRGLRVRMLLALLLLDAGRTVSSARLIDELWAESPPAGAANALQSLVSRLRTAIEPVAVELAAGGYRLDVPPDVVDTGRFELLAAEGRRVLAGGDPRLAADRLREALALWRGEPLADLTGAGFAGAAVARLGRLRLAAMEDRIEADLATGRATELLAELEALVAAHPLDERLRGLLMRSLYAAGRPANALALFAETRRLLADELGVDPSPELDRLHTAMLRRDPGLSGAAGPGTGALRAQLTSFVGREAAMEQVASLLAARRLVTLVGPGGTGKTRLAVELAARDRSRVRLIELASLSDPAEVPQAVLAAVGAREAGLIERGARAPDPIARVTSALAGKRLLLVLDNCEHLIDAAARLAAAVLAASPEVRVLATSREPLGVTGESLWPVPPLELPPPEVDAAAAPGFPAVRLFLDRATAVRPAFGLDERNVAAVAQVCRRLDGIPLAIELAAARLRSLTVEQVAERLDDRFALLTGGSRIALPRHQTLRALVDWSWELLEEPERVLLRRLSVFSGGATVETAERVCSGGGLVPRAVLDLLSRLVDRSLLEAVPSEAGTMRYRLMETVRAYAVERLADAGEEHAVRRAYAEHFCALAESADPALHGPEQLAWLTRLRAEHDNLQAALRWALDAGEAALAQRLAVALVSYWALRGYRVEARSRLGAAAALTGDVPVPVRAATQTALAWMAIDEGNIAQAAAPYQAARDLYLESGERPHPVFAILEPILAYLAAGDEAGARAGLVRVQADAGTDGWIRASALMLLGLIDLMAGRHAQAEANLAAAVDRSREAGDRWALAQALGRLAELAENRGDLSRAEAAVLEAIDQIGPLDAHEDMAWLRIRLGVIRILSGDEAGLEQVVAGIDRARDIGAMETVSIGLYYTAALARRDGDLAAARRNYEESLLIMDAMPASAWLSAYPVIGLGFVAELEGDVEGAEAWHRRALQALAEERPTGPWNRPIVADAVEGLAGTAALVGRAERAAELLGAAAAIRGPAPVPLLNGWDTERVSAAAREQLGAERFEQARRRGEAMTLEDVVGVTA
jgi:predicted ATPase/DNA-binding SARP family transcriptional activator